MKPKQIILLGVIFGMLALGVFLKTWVRSAEDRASSAQRSDVPVAGFDPAKVARILIALGTRPQPVELVKENGTWKVRSLWGAKADQVLVETLLQKLHAVRGEVRGTGKKLFPDFSIQDSEAFSIKLLDAGGVPLADLRLGKKRAGEEGYFLRKATGEEVYLVDLNMAELLGLRADFDEAAPLSTAWPDLALFNVNPEQVTKITIDRLKKGGEGFLVLGILRAADPKDPAKNVWKFDRGATNLPVDPEKVLKYIATLLSIKAQKVVDPAGKGYGLEDPVWELTVFEGGKKTTLIAGPKIGKGDLYYVKSSAGNSIFALNAGFFDDLNADDTHFVKGAPQAAAPKKDPSEGISAGLTDEQGLLAGQGQAS